MEGQKLNNEFKTRGKKKKKRNLKDKKDGRREKKKKENKKYFKIQKSCDIEISKCHIRHQQIMNSSTFMMMTLSLNICISLIYDQIKTN